MFDFELSSRSKKVMKKMKDKKLIRKYLDRIEEICEAPYSGDKKLGDLEGTYGVHVSYIDGTHCILYFVIEDREIIYIILLGPHERFYEEAKRVWREMKEE